MADELMRIQSDDGSTVLVEIERPKGGFSDVAFDGTIVKAQETFEQALGDVRTMAFKALDAFRGGTCGPDQVELEFGVKFKAEAGAAVLAKVAGEGHLVVRLAWSGKVGNGGAESDDE
ncbi:CU044_2847 family protein [Micromonospora sp. WMMC264]|uniref:CU044_2847 family protein n=1 Tax=Micromonospora sp. WMMC264 TaxID=3015158 RepID=UPI00248B7D71|nr:CU044_2847 family protein [Micromonospora sp. WMMC264]WBB88183.1 CU044_2847 family protein [Micromonospora sp. WMMC264]